jgi:hypothetical protein
MKNSPRTLGVKETCLSGAGVGEVAPTAFVRLQATVHTFEEVHFVHFQCIFVLKFSFFGSNY